MAPRASNRWPGQALWVTLPVAERRPQTAGDAHKQAQTCKREQGAHKQASRRVHAEQRSIGRRGLRRSRWLRGVLAEGSRSEDSSGRAACAPAGRAVRGRCHETRLRIAACRTGCAALGRALVVVPGDRVSGCRCRAGTRVRSRPRRARTATAAAAARAATARAAAAAVAPSTWRFHRRHWAAAAAAASAAASAGYLRRIHVRNLGNGDIRERNLRKLCGRSRCAHRPQTRRNDQNRDPPHADPLGQFFATPSQAFPSLRHDKRRPPTDGRL